MSQSPFLFCERPGCRDGITRITADLVKNHLANPSFKTRFEKSKDVERRAVEFFCADSGGPETYTGQDMVSMHRRMNVSEQEFVSVTDDVMAVTERSGIDVATCNDVLATLGP